MPRDDGWEELSPLSVDDDDDEDIGIGIAHGRRSFSYYRLPEPLLKLSVLKLDGSSFDVRISRTASVRELKLAVEDIFVRWPKTDGIQISWSHVWSHFCLCYEGRKLTDDRASLQTFGIKDGVQLRFVRHISVNNSPTKRQPRKHDHVAGLGHHRRSSTAPEVLLEKFEENGKKKKNSKVGHSRYEVDYYKEHEEGPVGRKAFRLSHFFMGFFSYYGFRRRKFEGRNRIF